MKKGTKIALGSFMLLAGVAILSGCTASFCSTKDKAHILYMFDYGVTNYYSSLDDPNIPQGVNPEQLVIDGVTVENVYASYSVSNNTYLTYLETQASSSNILCPSIDYYKEVDAVVLERALSFSGITDFSSLTVEEIVGDGYSGGLPVGGVLSEFGYQKFYDDTVDMTNQRGTLWKNWNDDEGHTSISTEVRERIAAKGLNVNDVCPTTDFAAFYKKTLTSSISSYRSCLTLNTGNYGLFGYKTAAGETEIQGKSWGFAWTIHGFPLMEGLFVWPIGALTDVLCSAFVKGCGSGVGQFLAILVVTVIVRGLMMIFTINQTKSTAKMTALQPEVTKLQEKYPSPSDKQILAQKTSELYKKNGINPMSSMLTMIVQYPVFICVWAALQGSAWLSTGSFLGLNLGSSISSALFGGSSAWTWGGGAPTALVLFILMSATQAVAMLLPQWMQKAKAKKVAKLGVNSAKKEQDNKMKWFTYIMLIMIIFMGFSLPSAMGVYWFVGALISLIQTLITQSVTDKHKKEKKR